MHCLDIKFQLAVFIAFAVKTHRLIWQTACSHADFAQERERTTNLHKPHRAKLAQQRRRRSLSQLESRRRKRPRLPDTFSISGGETQLRAACNCSPRPNKQAEKKLQFLYCRTKSYSLSLFRGSFLWCAREIKIHRRRKIAFCYASFPRPGTPKFNQNDKYSSDAVGRGSSRADTINHMRFHRAQSRRFLWAARQIRVDLIESNRA